MNTHVTPTIAETALGILTAGFIITAGLFIIYLIHGWGSLDNDHHDIEDD